jgi:hypothetical protein
MESELIDPLFELYGQGEGMKNRRTLTKEYKVEALRPADQLGLSLYGQRLAEFLFGVIKASRRPRG